ncbi:MAG: hypothetical protein IJ829_06530, partial [Kiritimatiellae bacterium]|nr:hypothetical protein [Kiritimatiellia bacterium]
MPTTATSRRARTPSPRQREALAAVAAGRFYPDLVREDDGWHARWRAVGPENDWVDEYVRAPLVTVLSEDAEDDKFETLHDAWAMALRSRTGLVRWDDAECASFAAELAAWHGVAEVDATALGRMVFTLAADAGGCRLTCPLPKGRAEYSVLGQAAYVCGVLRGLRRVGEGLSVALTTAEADD